MNIEKYFQSLTNELEGLKDRVRNFIDDAHWLTDGEWKESVIRSFLDRNFPATYKIGRGFIITPDGPTTQIDLILYKSSSPVMFRDGDLVFLPPQDVVGIIEVKTKVTKTTLNESLEKLGTIFQKIKRYRKSKILFGLFSYENSNINYVDILNILRKISDDFDAVVDLLCIGKNRFVKYWEYDPNLDGLNIHEKWHSYTVRNMAPGYFIHNVLEHLSPETIGYSESLWFPHSGKEIHKDGEIYKANSRHDEMTNFNN